MSIRYGEGWSTSLRDALARLTPEDQAEFESDELLRIEAMFQVRWRQLAYRQDSMSYRRTLIGTWPPGEEPARFYYSVQARLLPNMDIELEHLTIDWDYSPPQVE